MSKDLIEIKNKLFTDNRGYFTELWNKKTFKKIGINDVFVQDNLSVSYKRGTIRGLHLQKPPYAQAKLIRCTKGKIIDFVVDIRLGSPDYGKWKSFELSQKNSMQLYIPVGFLHGFITMTDNTEINYKCSNYYSKKHEVIISFNDPEININWPLKKYIMSAKDKQSSVALNKFKNPFRYKK